MKVDFVSEAEGSHRPAENFLVNAEVAQGSNGHIAADAGKTIEIEDSHGIIFETTYPEAAMFPHLPIFRNLAGLAPLVFFVHSALAATPEQVNAALGIPLFADQSLWDDDAEKTATNIGLRKESQTSTDSSYRLYTDASKRVLGARPYSIALYGEGGKVSGVSFMFANKGDSVQDPSEDPKAAKRGPSSLDKQVRAFTKAVRTDSEALKKALTTLFGEPKADLYGKGRQTRETVKRWDWQGHAILLASPREEYVALRVLPTAAADSGAGIRISDTEMRKRLASRIQKRPTGDVVLTDIPMVDQGPKGYCVPATWERVMRYMGISADMYVLAMAGGTNAGGGTNLDEITEGAKEAVTMGGRRVDSGTPPLTIQKIRKCVDGGIPIIWQMYSMDSVNDMIDKRMETRTTAMSDPVAWMKSLANTRRDAKKIKIDPKKGHVCMIIGYNEKTNEVAVSDSWGPDWAERWMTIEEVVAVSGGKWMTINL